MANKSIFENSKIFKTLLLFNILLGLFYASIETLGAQNNSSIEILSQFKEYSDTYKEVAFCHLNKSTYIKGEMIGFSAYVLNKHLKTPSELSRNLYCVIKDSNSNIIKKKMVKLINGFTNNIFKVDSTFKSGNYTFTAFTNWMKNSKEPNAYIESFVVLDPQENELSIQKKSNNALDVQFFPEGGHLVDDVQLTVGVTVKDNKGFGVSNANGKVYNSKNDLVASFTTNGLGFARFLFIPKLEDNYIARIDYNNLSHEFKIDNIGQSGITINVIPIPNGNMALDLRTNDRTLKDISGKPFHLIVHNGKVANGLTIEFIDKNKIQLLNSDILFPGINIITLIDENYNPILERLFFNYKGLKVLEPSSFDYKKVSDSIQIVCNLAVKNYKLSNISVSVLPLNTKSYNKHNNILSQVYLQPYVKGTIENAQYYFEDVDSKKMYDLDNLLITQGWSSYSWEDIFESNESDQFTFEDGIELKVNRQNKRQNDFMVYPLKSNNGFVINIIDDRNSFSLPKLYPEEDEEIGIGTLNNQGKIRKPDIYLQFFPSKVPEFQNIKKPLDPKFSPIDSNSDYQFATPLDIGDAQILDSVYIETQINENRIRKLEGDAFSSSDIFDDRKRAKNLTLIQYINYYIPSLIAAESGGRVNISTRIATSILADTNEVDTGARSPAIYLNDVLIPDLDYFYFFNMNTVDYVTYNRHGLGQGFQGANGVIKIYTLSELKDYKRNNSFVKYDFPLAFSTKKKFYVPKYDMKYGQFFEDYGIYDWFPDCTFDDRGNINFTIYNPRMDSVILFIEGVTEDGEFISERKIINFNNVD